MTYNDCANALEPYGFERHDAEIDAKPPFFARYRRSCKNGLMRQARVRPFPYATVLSYCCDKKFFYQSMVSAGYSKSVPETYISYDALRRVESKEVPSKGEVWYVKTSDGCHGRGVQVFNDFKNLKQHIRTLRNEPYVIQRGVSNIHLIDGKKWTIRTHVLVTPDLRILRHNDGVIIVHSEEYVQGATERAIQILHNSKAGRYSLRDGPAADLLPVLEPQIDRISFEVCDSIRARLWKSTQQQSAVPDIVNASYYAMLGLDLILDTSNVVHCLEVNEFPQLDFSSDPSAHAVVVKTFKDLLSEVVFPVADVAAAPNTGWVPVSKQLCFEPEILAAASSKEEKPSLLSPFAAKTTTKKKSFDCGAVPHSTDAEKAENEPEPKPCERKERKRRVTEPDGIKQLISPRLNSVDASKAIMNSISNLQQNRPIPEAIRHVPYDNVVTEQKERESTVHQVSYLSGKEPSSFAYDLARQDLAQLPDKPGGENRIERGHAGPAPPRIACRFVKPRQVLRMNRVGVRVAGVPDAPPPPAHLPIWYAQAQAQAQAASNALRGKSFDARSVKTANRTSLQEIHSYVYRIQQNNNSLKKIGYGGNDELA